MWAPCPNRVARSPLQTTEGLAMAVTVGSGLTLITMLLTELALQPVRVLVPVAVYVAVLAGVKATPGVHPGLRVYTSAPATEMVTLSPLHRLKSLAPMVTVGWGLTVTASVALLEQPVRVWVPTTV